MKKKARSTVLRLLAGILLVVLTLAIGLGSHYVSYYGIGTNPLPNKLTAAKIDSICVDVKDPTIAYGYALKEKTLTDAERDQTIALYNALDMDLLGFDPTYDPGPFLAGNYPASFSVTLTDGEVYLVSVYAANGLHEAFGEVIIHQNRTNERWKFDCDYETAAALHAYLTDQLNAYM